MSRSTTKLTISLVALIGIFLFLYFFTGAFGGTFLGISLNNNPNLQNGLVAHYTFDGEFETGTFEFGTGGATTTDPSPDPDRPYGIAVDDSGYVYITGQYCNSTSGECSGVLRGMYTMKINPLDGSTVWASSTNYTQDTIGFGIDVGADGFLYIHGDVDDLECTDQNDVCTRTYKIDPSNGDLIWYTTVNPSLTSSNEYAQGMTTDSAGFVYSAVSATDDACGGSGSDRCFYVYKLDQTDGSVLWTLTSDPTDADEVADEIATDNNGNLYVTGYTRDGTENFCSLDTWCMYTIKIDADSGTEIWATTTDLGGSNQGYDVVTDNSGFVYVTGLLDGSACGGSGSDRCSYTFKIDPDNGDMLWATTTDPSDDDDYTYGMAVGPQGYLYLTGLASSTACGGGSRGSCVYTYKVDPANGDMLWATTIDPTDGNDIGNAIEVDQKTGFVYVAAECGNCGEGGTGAMYFFKLDPNDGSFVDTTSAGAIASLGESVNGNIGQGVELDGVDDYIAIEDPGLPTNDFTYAFWAYPRNLSNNQYFLSSTGVNEFVAALTTGEVRIFIDSNGWDTDEPLVVNRWTHISFTRVGSDVDLYLDGQLATSTTMSGTLDFSGCELLLGTDSDSGCIGELDQFYDGFLDDVRTYNRGLSASEILRLYQLGATTKIAKTIDSNDALKNGLVGHFTFDEGTIDSASNTAEVIDFNTSTFTGDWRNHATTTRPGKIGQGLSFDGSDDYIELGSNAALDNMSEMSLSAWVKPNSFGVGGKGRIFNKHDGAADFVSLNLNNVDETNGVEFYIKGTTGLSVITTNSISVGEWQHIVLIWDGSATASNVEVYINGVLQSHGTDQDLVSRINDSGATFKIGDRGDGTRAFDGIIDDARIYNRVLSAGEVKRLYELGATTKIAKTLDTNPDLKSGLVGHWTFDGAEVFTQVTDQSGTGNTGYLSSGMSTGTAVLSGVIGQSLLFDGINDFVDLGDDASLELSLPITLSAWIKKSSGGTFQGVVATDGTNGDYYGAWLQISSSETLYVNYGDGDLGGPGARRTKAGNTVLRDNEWYHVAAVLNGPTDMNLYVNGVDDGGSYSGTGDSITYSTDPATIGTDEDNIFAGAIDDVRIYDRTLSAQEILRLYQLGN